MPTTIDTYWDKFLNGDKFAFEQIYRSLVPQLYEYGMRHYKDETLVRDAIQDVFVKFWESRAKLKNITSPKHYLLVAMKKRP
ncbi:RNA polymerase sigma factor [Sphingobacterium nematocida]|nr:sigma factor [Sphingobacterium nematocida]